jgi:DNA-binding transcriptional ArsR family regulator
VKRKLFSFLFFCLQSNLEISLFKKKYRTISLFFQFYIVILQYKNIAMGATKTDHFTESQNELAVLAKALGHPARIAIMEYLLKVDACICGDIVNELPLSQPTVSQHLKELKNAGLIKGSIEGNSICYCINEPGLEKIKSFFEHISAHLAKKRNECC